jgi:signal transduction histidine kinase
LDPKTRTINHLNKNAIDLLSPSKPAKVDELPPWPLLPVEKSSKSLSITNISLPEILDLTSIFPSKYKSYHLSNNYEISVHNFSSSFSLIIISKVHHQIQDNSNNLKMLSYVSHEFRTPLNCINTMLDALTKKAPEYLLETYIIPARDSLGYLLALVNDFLDMSQMIAGKFSLAFSEFKLRNLTKNVMKLMHLQAELKGISLLYEESKEIPEEVCSDPARLRQVLINLMSNAMKYTNEGSIKVHIHNLK